MGGFPIHPYWVSSSFFVALCSSSIFSDSGLRHFEALALSFCSMDTFCVCQLIRTPIFQKFSRFWIAVKVQSIVIQ